MKRSVCDSAGTGFVGKTIRRKEKTVMRLFILMCMMLISAIGGWADVVLPCVAQDAAALAGTTCAIGDKAFSFGAFVNHTEIAIGFIPDVGDSGFTLSGAASFTSADFLGGVFYQLPFDVATMDGSQSITGLATQILNPALSGSTPFVQSYFNIGAPSVFDEFHLEAGSLVELTNVPFQFPPFSPFIGLEALTEGAGDVAGFSGAHFEILQTTPPAPVPEPAAILLLGSALAAIGIGRRRRRLRNT
jgi:hypothetical protein